MLPQEVSGAPRSDPVGPQRALVAGGGWGPRWHGRYERVLRGRVYGAEPGHPVPLAGQTYVELRWPLDGLLLNVTGWSPDEIGTGVTLETELGQFGPGGRHCMTRARAMRVASTEPETALTAP